MEDEQIIQLYFRRSEDAIAETAVKYGYYCRNISYGILRNMEDAEECETDTYLRVWNSIPPEHPRYFSAYLGKIVRNLSLSRYRRTTAKFRGGSQVRLAYEELEHCIPSIYNVEETVEETVLVYALENFLRHMPQEKRRVFLLRYWYFRTIPEICDQLQMSEAKVRSMLFRMRKDLKKHLEKEGIFL